MKNRKTTTKASDRRSVSSAAANLRKAKASKRPASRGKQSTRKAEKPPAIPKVKRTKADELVTFLRTEGGRSIDAVCAEFNWLPHSARAAISRLGSEKGQKVDTIKGDNGTIYAIKPPCSP